MGDIRNKGWPKTLRDIVLFGLDRGISQGFPNPWSPFEIPVAIKEYSRRTSVFLWGKLALAFTFTGPDKDDDYKLRILDEKGKEIISLFINLCNRSSRQAAEGAVADMLSSRIRSLGGEEGILPVWKEFYQRDFELRPLEP